MCIRVIFIFYRHYKTNNNDSCAQCPVPETYQFPREDRPSQSLLLVAPPLSCPFHHPMASRIKPHYFWLWLLSLQNSQDKRKTEINLNLIYCFIHWQICLCLTLSTSLNPEHCRKKWDTHAAKKWRTIRLSAKWCRMNVYQRDKFQMFFLGSTLN